VCNPQEIRFPPAGNVPVACNCSLLLFPRGPCPPSKISSSKIAFLNRQFLLPPFPAFFQTRIFSPSQFSYRILLSDPCQKLEFINPDIPRKCSLSLRGSDISYFFAKFLLMSVLKPLSYVITLPSCRLFFYNSIMSLYSTFSPHFVHVYSRLSCAASSHSEIPLLPPSLFYIHHLVRRLALFIIFHSVLCSTAFVKFIGSNPLPLA
jgi:hypothetical protein